MKKLVLLHGAIGASDQLERLELLLKEKYQVFAIDFSGHGKRAGETTDYSIQSFANDLDIFLRENKIDHPGIFGYSMGGYVAIYHSLNFANKAEKIVTLGTKFDWTIESSLRESKMLNSEIIEKKIPQFAQQLKIRHGEHNWKKVLQKTSEMILEMGKKPPLREDQLSSLEVPVRFGVGDKDTMVSLEETIRFYKAAKTGSMYVMPETHHPVEKVNLDDLFYQINKFI